MYRADAPTEMKPVGEIEFVNGTSAMSASGQFGKSRLCAGIVGRIRESLRDAGRGDRLQAHGCALCAR
jgi:L-fuconolactonase